MRKIYTFRLDATQIAWLDRAGSRQRSWRLRRDLEILERLIYLAAHQPHIPVGEAIGIVGEKI